MKIDKYYRKLGITTLKRLKELHSTYDDRGIIRNAMSVLFGEPTQCLICGEPLVWKRQVPNDVDPWFCEKHCPICNIIE